MKTDTEKIKDLERLALPLMQYLRDNFNPHMSIHIDSDRSELLAGHATFGYPAHCDEDLFDIPKEDTP